MAQFDLLLTQNVAPSGVEFTERYINIAKGGLLTALENGTPVVLPVGANGHMLIADSAEPSGFKWVAVAGGHTQNTDTGTTNQTFQLESGANGPKLKSWAGALHLRNAADTSFVETTAQRFYANERIPASADELTSKEYVDGLLAANDAMIFKGTIGVSGTVTALPTTHGIGWTYKVITAATYAGKACEIGDLIISLVKRTGTGNVNTDWAVVQANIDGAVVKDGNLVNNSLTVGAGASSVKDLPLAANSVVVAITANTPSALAIAASNFVGRAASGNVAALSASAARTILNVADGANNYSHPHHSGDVTSVNDGITTIAAKAVTLAKMADVASGTIFYRKTADAGAPEVQTLATLKADLGTMPIAWVAAPANKTASGTAGQAAYDSNFLYVATGTNVWKRSPLSTNW